MSQVSLCREDSLRARRERRAGSRVLTVTLNSLRRPCLPVTGMLRGILSPGFRLSPLRRGVPWDGTGSVPSGLSLALRAEGTRGFGGPNLPTAGKRLCSSKAGRASSPAGPFLEGRSPGTSSGPNSPTSSPVPQFPLCRWLMQHRTLHTRASLRAWGRWPRSAPCVPCARSLPATRLVSGTRQNASTRRNASTRGGAGEEAAHATGYALWARATLNASQALPRGPHPSPNQPQRRTRARPRQDFQSPKSRAPA